MIDRISYGADMGKEAGNSSVLSFPYTSCSQVLPREGKNSQSFRDETKDLPRISLQVPSVCSDEAETL